jgi:hypothetical protein
MNSRILAIAIDCRDACAAGAGRALLLDGTWFAARSGPKVAKRTPEAYSV